MGIGIGSQVNTAYGTGIFRKEATGTVIEVRDDGKYKVAIEVAGQETWVITGEVSLIESEPEMLTRAGEELNPDTELEAPEEPVKVKKPKAKKEVEAAPVAVENLPEPVEKKPEAEAVSAEDKWMKPLRYDMEFLGPLPTTYRIAGRQKIRGIRHYVVCFEDQHEPWFLPSATSFIDEVVPKGKSFYKWMIDTFQTYNAYMDWMNEKAAYGSIVHGAIADFVNGTLPAFEDNDAWYGYMQMVCERNGFKSKANAWLNGVQMAVIDFWQWCIDYRVRIILLEQPLASRKLGIAGQLDLFVEMDSHIQKKTGKFAFPPTRVLAIPDIKTGAPHAWYNPQLGMYGELLLETFPGIGKIIKDKYPDQWVDGKPRLKHGIIVPKDFRKEPSYTFVWRTDKVEDYMQHDFEHHLHSFRRKIKRPGHVRKFTGKPDLTSTMDGVITFRTLEEEWMDRIRQGNYGEDVEIVTEEDDDGEEES